MLYGATQVRGGVHMTPPVPTMPQPGRRKGKLRGRPNDLNTLAKRIARWHFRRFGT